MKAIIFDIDGTLLDSTGVDDRYFIQAFQETFDIDLTHQKWEEITHVTDQGITEEIVLSKKGTLPSASEVDQFKSRFFHLMDRAQQDDPAQFATVAGVETYLKNLLQSNDYLVGFATGAWEESAHIKLRSLPFLQDIVLSTSSHHTSREDITKRTIKLLEEKSTKELSEIIYFGDGLWDHKTCGNLGIHFVGIDVKNNNKLKNNGAQHVFRDYTDLQAIQEAVDSFKTD